MNTAINALNATDKAFSNEAAIDAFIAAIDVFSKAAVDAFILADKTTAPAVDAPNSNYSLLEKTGISLGVGMVLAVGLASANLLGVVAR